MQVKRPTLRVAAAQPVTITGDVRANALTHSEAVRACAARVVVFPEMSLTGYSMDAPSVDVDDAALRPLVEACRDTGSVALAGAAVRHRPRPAIGVLAVSAAGTEIVYRKVHLGASETEVYAPGRSAAVVEIDGWRIGLGICKDTRVDHHLTASIAAGIDLYVAGLVHAPQDIAEFDVRARRIAALGAIPVVFAGFAGPTGGGYASTCGGSAIWDAAGHCLMQANDQPGERVVADLSA
ncbi:carbon-nitrogen hydrolase family protein [Aldersonia sp. NBC_00410]|uniref:carbon-nitrogen hydrolase family protein n=1 Tax=Aldersonia sp. NBC_00410 TaxID=2975954 RepID=UPI0022547703|nr:carbon-nitrogen hydrolase family protein [Aldersonia sp. NBC_00410]MCX5045756.1 carbon-nitrogen hydrolase family protein [Aldersonia sp. NBC_00410]